MKALILNCTLKFTPEVSNTEALARVVQNTLEQKGVETEMIRVVDLNIRPGVKTDEGNRDDWPRIHERLLASEILVMASPTWMAQMSSVAKRVLERMDAMLSETTAGGVPVAFNRVAGFVVTGNEDGAHHVIAEMAGPLIDIGYTIPGQAWTYWHKGPGPGESYLDTDYRHDWSEKTGITAANNLFALATALKAAPFNGK